IILLMYLKVFMRLSCGIKRRCRPGMGRCQGGFCGPLVQEIIARELNINIEEVMQDKEGSYILDHKTK
ncbi:MAG: hypothetical protein ACRC68_05135, partial [Clostridium sp.]